MNEGELFEGLPPEGEKHDEKAVPEATTVKPEDIKEAFKEAVVELRQPEQKETQWQPKFRVDADMMESFVTEPSQAAELLNNLYRSAVEEVASLVVPYIEAQLQPLRYIAQQAEAERLTKAFLDKHKDLEPYLDEARQVAEELLKNPTKQYKSWDELFDDVAEKTKQVVNKWQTRFGAYNQAPVRGSKASPLSSSNFSEDEDEAAIRAIIGATRSRK